MSKVAALLQAQPNAKVEAPPAPHPHRSIVRFDVHQRAQHFIMMSSVIILVLTGMPQKFSSLGVSQWVIGVFGGIDTARMLHRAAGFAMILSAVYHVAYLVYTWVVLKRPIPVWMIPTPRDLRDFAMTIGHHLGLTKEKPQFGRFSYIEKFDYWAVFWGVPIMAGTGLVLIYPLVATSWMPGVIMPVATIAHSDEAVLASGWLLTVHFYNAHLAPHIFPFNRSIFTGRVDEHRYEEEHPLEYARILEGIGPAQIVEDREPAAAESV